MERFELYLYDYVCEWSDSTSASSVVEQLRRTPDAAVEVFINSRGGDVYEGFAIYNALRRHRGRVTTRVDNAFSIASIIAQAGDVRMIGPAGLMMIHNPWYDGWAGQSDELRSAADMLDQLANQMADIYALRSGKTRDEALKAMATETWYTADEAQAWGLVDGVETNLLPLLPGAPATAWTPTALAALRTNQPSGGPKAAYALQSRPAVFALGLTTANPTSTPVSKPTFLARIRAALGLDDTTPDDAVADAVEKLVQDDDPATDLPAPDVPTPAAPAANAAPLAALQQENDGLKARLAALEAKGHEATVDAAVADFRIAAADKVDWLKDFAADAPRAAARLERIPKGAVRPGADVNGSATGAPVTITRAEARNASTYRDAKAKASLQGVKLEILD